MIRSKTERFYDRMGDADKVTLFCKLQLNSRYSLLPLRSLPLSYLNPLRPEIQKLRFKELIKKYNEKQKRKNKK